MVYEVYRVYKIYKVYRVYKVYKVYGVYRAFLGFEITLLKGIAWSFAVVWIYKNRKIRVKVVVSAPQSHSPPAVRPGYRKPHCRRGN